MRPTNFMGEDAPPGPVLGTISRDDTGDTYFNSGYVGKTVGNTIPFPVNRAVLERGRERFNIYCAPCHARTGDGNGMIVQRGYRRPPSYHTDRLRNAPLGHFFVVITNGFGAMPDYQAQVSPRDRWAIAAYIRALQLSQYAPASLLPAGALPTAPALPGTPGSGATPAQAAPQSGNLEASEGPSSEVQKKAAEEKKKRKQKELEVEHK
jgi:cytochrome c553